VTDADVIVQLPRGSSIDANLRADPPTGVTAGRAILEHLTPGEDGRLAPVGAGDIVLTVASPEALGREPDEVRRAIAEAADQADADAEPIIVLVDGAEFLRDDELDPVLLAAEETDRVVILRIMEGV
jgi:hypothetical protein